MAATDSSAPYALALSGGGFRATLFHTGALLRLNELSLLPRFSHICGISGGAIIAGLLGARWSRLKFDAAGRATNFAAEIVEPLQRFCRRHVDFFPSIANIGKMLFGLPSTALQSQYDQQLFHGLSLDDLPAPGQGPQLSFIAVNLTTGAELYFKREVVEEKRLGRMRLPELKLATVVAASSAYPPFLSPVVVYVDPAQWTAQAGADLHGDARVARKLVLTDGGVYDALGFGPLWGECSTLLVSNASEVRAVWKASSFWPRQWSRAMLLATASTAAISMRLLREFMPPGVRQQDGRCCLYWANGARIDDYGVAGALCHDSAVTRNLGQTRTRLNRFHRAEQAQLINWGYAQCDTALKQWRQTGDRQAPADKVAAWPMPDYAL